MLGSAQEFPRFFLNIRIGGGMDSTLGLDPWIGPRPDAGDLHSGSKLRNLGFGGRNRHRSWVPPHCRWSPHIHDLAVVNGIFMGPDDLGHPAAETYMTTAKSNPRASPTFVAELAENFPRLSPRRAGDGPL